MANVYDHAHFIAAKMAGDHTVMDVAAKKIQEKARALASESLDTGHYRDSIRVRTVKSSHGGVVKDRLVEATDPGALAIEYGHFAQKKDGTLGKYVPGKFILTRAVR